MTFWSGEKIAEECPSLISDFDPSRIDCNAYTLRMGEEYYCTSDASRPFKSFSKKRKLKPCQAFAVRPGQFAFLLTKEKIKVPAKAMAFISIRSKVKFKGLINVSGFHVDPGYDGHLVFSVYNAGPHEVNLSEGEPIFLLWYACLDRETGKTKSPGDSKSISNELVNGMNREVMSLQGLADEISSIKTGMKVQSILFGVGVTFFLSILAAIIIFFVQEGIEITFISPLSPVATETVGSDSTTTTVNTSVPK